MSRFHPSMFIVPSDPTYTNACARCGLNSQSRVNLLRRFSYCPACIPVVRALQKKARYEVRKARREGRLPPASSYLCADCECPAEVYDHRSYDRPLDVVAVCQSCNTKRGPAAWTHIPPSSATVPARLSAEHRTGSYYPVGKDRLLTADEQAIPAGLGSQSVPDLSGKPTTDVVGSAT
jgi:hypothetical protein